MLNDADIKILNMLKIVRELLSHFLHKCYTFMANQVWNDSCTIIEHKLQHKDQSTATHNCVVVWA